jgi:hypothetical protein
MAPDWQLLTGGRYSEVVIRTGLTVLVNCTFKFYFVKILLVNFIRLILPDNNFFILNC